MTVAVLDSHITAVTVFRSGALVRREARLQRSDGSYPTTARLTGLPLSLDDGSLVVRVIRAAAEVAPVALSARVVLEVPEPDAALAQLNDEELRRARQEVRRLEERIAATRAMVSRWSKMASPRRPRGAPGSPPPPPPAQARLAFLGMCRAESRRLSEGVEVFREDLEAARDRLRSLEDAHGRASTARQAREHELRKSVIVQLRCDSGATGQCTLEVEYLVPGARWVPSYAIRFCPGFGAAELAMRALVCQASGEDWSDVRLTVATADPHRWTELPELRSLRIGRRQPPPPHTGWREPPEGAEALLADYDRARQLTAARMEAVAEAEPVPRVAAAAAAPMDDLAAGLLEEAVATEPEADFEEEAMLEMAIPVAAEVALAAGAPPPASARPKAARKKSKAALPQPGAAPPRPSIASAEPEGGLTAPVDLLDYGRLRLAAADEQRRGQLRPVAEEELYLELLVQMQVEVQFDVRLTLQQARSRAGAVAEQRPPVGHCFPEPWQGFDSAYVAEAPATVTSDGSYHGVSLLHRSTSGELRYVTVPRLNDQVFRTVILNNPLQSPLPEGPADIMVGDEYLIGSRLHHVAPGGSVELGVGVEESIKVARNTRFAEHTSGLLGGSLDLEHCIEIEVASHLSHEALVEIRERLPVTREGDDTAKIEVTAVEPPWQTFHQKEAPIEGSYRWLLTLPPGEQRTARATYVIGIDAKHELVGGNRREE